MFGQWLGQWPGQWYGGESTGEPGITGEIATTLQGASALFVGSVTGTETEQPSGGPGGGEYARSEISDAPPLRGGSILSDADLQSGPDLRPDRIDRSGRLVLAKAPGQRTDSIDRATVQAARAARPAGGLSDDEELMLVTALLAVMDDD